MEVFRGASLVHAGALALRSRRESTSVRTRIAEPAGVSIENDVDAESHAAA
jgi:hypothetical protein